MTDWSDHVKIYAKKHKMSYREANTNSKCKEAYQKKKKRMSPRKMKMPGRQPVARHIHLGERARSSERRNTVEKRKVSHYIHQKEAELESYSDIFYVILAKITEKEVELGTSNYYQLEREEFECSGLIDQANSILDEILKAGFLRPRLLDEYDAVLENIRQCIEDFKRKYIVLKEEIVNPCPENCQNGIDCHQCGDNPSHKCRLECEFANSLTVEVPLSAEELELYRELEEFGESEEE